MNKEFTCKGTYFIKNRNQQEKVYLKDNLIPLRQPLEFSRKFRHKKKLFLKKIRAF